MAWFEMFVYELEKFLADIGFYVCTVRGVEVSDFSSSGSWGFAVLFVFHVVGVVTVFQG